MIRTLALVLLVTLLAFGLWMGRSQFDPSALAGNATAVMPGDVPPADLGRSPVADLAPKAGPNAARDDARSVVDDPSSTLVVTHGALIVRARLEEGAVLADFPVWVKPERSVRPMSETREVRTDVEGNARIEGLLPGRVYIRSPYGGNARAEIVVGEEVEAEFVLKDVVDVIGQVLDTDDEPVPDARVWLISWRRDWLSALPIARCDTEGRFEVQHVSTYHSLGASAAGHGPSELIDLEHVDTSQPPVELQLELTAGGGDLRGRVLSSGSEPLAGALVAAGDVAEYEMRADGSRAENWNARIAVTDATGLYRLDGLPAGEQPVRVYAENHPQLEAEVEIIAGEVTILNIELTRGVVATGVVRDEAGEPVPEAVVLSLDAPFVDPFPTQGPTDHGAPFHRPAVRSGKDGSYRLPDLPLGTIHLHASKGTSSWGDGNFEGTVQETFTDVTTGPIEWDPVLVRGRRIRGRVTFADGTPMGNVFVSAIEPDTERRSTVHADREGLFDIPALEDRAYTVHVQLWDQPDDARPLDEEDVWPSEDELLLVASYSKTVETQATLSARIVDTANRIEGKGSIVFAFGNGWTHPDEDNGIWSGTVRPGRYQARILYREKVVGLSEWVEIGPGDRHDFGEVHTIPACKLTVRVRRPPGFEETTAYVTVHGPDEQRFGGKPITPETDEISFEDQLEGHVTVVLGGPGIAVARRELTLVSGVENEVTFDLEGAARCALAIQCPPGRCEGFGLLTVTYRHPDGSVHNEAEWYEKWGGKLPLETHASLPIGRFTVEATTTSGLRASGELTIESLHDTPSLTLELQPQ